jgi:hypothetical protein
MAGGKPWTQEEIDLLLDMVRQGRGAEEIFKSGKFLGWSFRSIDTAVKRLSIAPQAKKVFAPQVGEAEIVGLETIVKRYLDAFNKICDLEQYDKSDLERFRIIFMAAWKYRDLFREYQEMERVEARIEELERKMAELQAKKKGSEVPSAA